MKQSLGRHLLIELYGCDARTIDDPERVRRLLLEAARLAEATIVTDVFHKFAPQGVSGVVVIAESHLAIHTWPEHGVASVDIFSCGSALRPERVEGFLKEAFGASRSEAKEHARGKLPVKAEATV